MSIIIVITTNNNEHNYQNIYPVITITPNNIIAKNLCNDSSALTFLPIFLLISFMTSEPRKPARYMANGTVAMNVSLRFSVSCTYRGMYTFSIETEITIVYLVQGTSVREYTFARQMGKHIRPDVFTREKGTFLHSRIRLLTREMGNGVHVGHFSAGV